MVFGGLWRELYRFLGWTNDADNNKVYASLAAAREAMDVFAASEMAAASEKDNHLYALWQVIVNDIPPTPPTPSTPPAPVILMFLIGCGFLFVGRRELYVED